MKGYKSLGQNLRIIKKYSWPILLPLCIGLLCIGLFLTGFYLGVRVRYQRLIKPTVETFPLTLKWQTNLGISNNDQPSYQNGTVFIPSYGYWHSINATTGEVIWSQGASGSVRCLTRDYLVVSDYASLANLEPNTGNIIWKGRGPGRSVSCSDTMVFVIGNRGFVYADDLATGENIWGGTNPRNNHSELIYNPETDELIIDGAIIANPDSGYIMRSFDPQFIGMGHIQINRGQMFVGVHIRDAQTGQILHLEERFSSGYGGVTVTENNIYTSNAVVEGSPKGVTALDRNTYEIKWQYWPVNETSYDLFETPMSPVTIFDGVGYVILADATLRAFNLETGTEIGYWQPQESDLFYWSMCTLTPFLGCAYSSGYGMATSEDTLFVSFGDGKLYAFGK